MPGLIKIGYTDKTIEKRMKDYLDTQVYRYLLLVITQLKQKIKI